MKDKETPVELLFQKAEDYSKTTLELLQLKTIDRAADVVSTVVAQIITFIAVSFAVTIVSIGIALWIGTLLNGTHYGFFIVGGFYTIVALMLHMYKNVWIKKPINNNIIQQMMKQKIL